MDDGAFTAKCARENKVGLAHLEAGFRAQGLEIVPSVANFVLVKVGDGARVFGELQKRGVIVRPMRPYGMPEWLRVTVGTTAQNERLLTTLAAVLKAERG